MAVCEYDAVEGDRVTIRQLCTRKDKSLIDLTGAQSIELRYKNGGALVTRPMTAPIPANAKAEYKALENEIKGGDIFYTVEIIDAVGERFTQLVPTHKRIRPRFA